MKWNSFWLLKCSDTLSVSSSMYIHINVVQHSYKSPFKNHPFYGQETFPLTQRKKKEKHSLVLSVVTSTWPLVMTKLFFSFFLLKWKKNEHNVKTKIKSKTSSCRISSILYIHTKLHFFFFSFKNRLCKHCFRSFRLVLSTYRLDSTLSLCRVQVQSQWNAVCYNLFFFSIENSPRLLLWHLQMIFALYPSTSLTF